MKRGLLCILCFLFGIFAVRVFDYITVTTVTDQSISETKLTDESEPSLITLLPPVYFTHADPKPNSNSGSLVQNYGFGYPVNATWSSNGNLSAPAKGPRSRPPSSYSLKFESFTTLLNSVNTDNYVSRPFSIGGYNWTLIVYPKGNKKDLGDGYISLYVMLDNSTFVADPRTEVYADLKFYVYNKNEENYYTIQDTQAKRFSLHKTVWGFSQVLSLQTFKDTNNGYLYDGDHCEFGVDVVIAKNFETWELYSVLDNFRNAKNSWSLEKFSTLYNRYYNSKEFSVGGRNWYLQVYPSGDGTGEGNSISVYILLGANEKLRAYEQIYVKAYLRVIDQLKSNHVEIPIDNWFNKAGGGWGRMKAVSFADLKDSSKGFLVRDTLKLEVEFLAISANKYFP